MSKSSDLTARAAKVSRRQGAGAAAASSASPTRTQQAKPVAKPVRVTVDLPPRVHRQLVSYSAELAETLGRARVPNTDVMRALIAQLDIDPDLRDAIAAQIAQQAD